MAERRQRRKTTTATAGAGWPKYNLRFDPVELAKNLKINKHALDDEIEHQPEIYGEVAVAAAQAKSQVDALEEELKELESDTDLRIRKQAEADEERVTENQIKNRVAGDPKRKKLAIKLLEAKDLERRLQALERSFRHKSYALRDMVDLFLSQYYAPRSVQGSKHDLEEAEVERTRERMGERREKRVSRNRKRTPK